MTAESITQIDIQQVLRQKAPSAARKIPQFVINYLTRTIHQDELNDILRRYHDKNGVAFMQELIGYFDLHLVLENESNLPTEGRYIFASNHPLGGPDGVILISFLGKRYPDLKFPVNDLLLNLKNLNNIFLPVNKHGAMAREAAAAIEEAYASSCQMIMFPAGLCSRKIKGKICDLTWQKSFVTKAVQYQRDIVPIFFSGKNSDFFYNLANFRKRIHLKANLEMLWLPDETFKKIGQHFTLYIGKPIPWQSLDKSRKPLEWAAEIKRQVYELPNLLSPKDK